MGFEYEEEEDPNENVSIVEDDSPITENEKQKQIAEVIAVIEHNLQDQQNNSPDNEE